MKITEMRVQPAKEYEAVTAIICDLCRFGRMNPHGLDDINWTEDANNIDQTCISRSEGYNCPSGGNQEGVEYHVCPTCFKTKLEPWLKEQGAVSYKTEVDW